MSVIKIVNAEGGSDARYDLGQMTADERARFDHDGRPLGADEPGQWEWTPGLPGARSMNAEGSGGGGSPFGNPYFQQLQAANQASEAADLADTKSQLQQLLIQFGLIPGDFKDKLGSLDDTIRALIAKNTESGISQYARMLEGKTDVRRDTVNRLSGRGLLRSGAKGYRMRRNQMDFDRQLSDAISAVLGTAGSLQSGYAGRALGRQTSLAQMLAQIYSNARSFGSGGGFTPQPRVSAAPPPPPTSIFTGESGSWGSPTIGGGTVGGGQPNFRLGGGSGTSSKKPLLLG